MDLSQGSDVEFVGSTSTTEVGYNESRSVGVRKLLQYYFPPKVSNLIIIRVECLINFPFLTFTLIYCFLFLTFTLLI